MKDALYKLMNWPRIEAVIYAEENQPKEVLGAKAVGSKTLIQCFYPGAESVKVKLLDDFAGKEFEMEMADEEGFFAALLPHKLPISYVYLVKYPEKKVQIFEDPYRFGSLITDEDVKKFQAGIHYEIYHLLGAHPMEIDGVKGTYFAVWAPAAERVSVVGDFNNWDGRMHPMSKHIMSGIYELFIPGEHEGLNYKFELRVRGGLVYLKSDPYAFGMQLRPDTASVVRSIADFEWTDDAWMRKRENTNLHKEPVNILEIHLGSFAKNADGGFLNYRKLAKKVIDYALDMHYSHVELMPVMEHPLDASWGYQVIGYYAPTARFGTPEDFQYFCNELHKAGIGIILDWVPAHFPRDTHGLSNFDGTCLYEHEDPRRGTHPDWGTLIFHYGRNEVSNYLIANGLFWIEQYHIDGIRMDAVASMLYLDYGRRDGDWLPNMYGGNENLEAMEFLKHFNSIVQKRNKGVVVIAEESTAWPKVTGALDDDGLGFSFKWNMGWMNDFLQYIKYDPYFRAHHHNELTFSMIYQYSENFMLVLSHDEVVHGKASLLGKMPGDNPQKFANMRASMAYMMMHPGKKLLFMGQDLGEFDEWNEERSVEWDLLKYDHHRQLHDMMRELNAFYHAHPALYEGDEQAEGFLWVNAIDYEHCLLSFIRKAPESNERLFVIVNFANVAYEKKDFGVPIFGKYKEVFNTDQTRFGGTGFVNPRQKTTKEKRMGGFSYTLNVDVAPLSVSVFTIESKLLPTMKEKASKKAPKKGKTVELTDK